MTTMPSSSPVPLPPGTTVSAGRETSQLSSNNVPIPGMLYTVTLPSGTTTSVFVPYTLMSNRAVVSQMIAQRVNDILGIESLGG